MRLAGGRRDCFWLSLACNQSPLLCTSCCCWACSLDPAASTQKLCQVAAARLPVLGWPTAAAAVHLPGRWSQLLPSRQAMVAPASFWHQAMAPDSFCTSGLTSWRKLPAHNKVQARSRQAAAGDGLLNRASAAHVHANGRVPEPSEAAAGVGSHVRPCSSQPPPPLPAHL